MSRPARQPAHTPQHRHPRLHRLARRLAAVAGVGAIGLALVVTMSWYEVNHTKLATLEQTSELVTRGRPLRIVQITDVHDRSNDAQRAHILQLTREQHPDLVAVTGDLINAFTTDLSRMDGFIGELVALQIPVFYVPGNHEYDNHSGHANLDEVLAMLRRHGVTVLENRSTTLDGPWGKLDVIGTGDYYTGHGDLPAAMQGTRADAYHFVLTHSPQSFDALAASAADLAVCGHTHGGQVRIPGIGALYAPGGGFLPRLDKGLFPTGGRASLYVDSGVGQSLPLRLFDQSQITLITITHP